MEKNLVKELVNFFRGNEPETTQYVVNEAMRRIWPGTEEGLIHELITLFQGQEQKTVEQAVLEAVKQAWPELVTGPLSELFDAQMKTLSARGCPKRIIDMFANQKIRVITKTMGTKIADDHIPFIPVIPMTEMAFEDLAKMVTLNDGRNGGSYLEQSDVINIIDVPTGPYFMFDVEDGKDMLNKPPEEAEVLIGKKGFSCLTADEGIALCVHTDVLYQHYVDCAGSYDVHPRRRPTIRATNDGPMVGWHFIDDPKPQFGSASCRSRM